MFVAVDDAEAGRAEMNKVYDGAEGAQAPAANERRAEKPGANYIWALGTGSMIETSLGGGWAKSNFFYRYWDLALSESAFPAEVPLVQGFAG